jgi:hypothetical protein
VQGTGAGHRDIEVLGGAPVVAVMKGPWRLRRRGLRMGASGNGEGSWHNDDDGVPAVAVCAPIASLMVVRRRQHAREIKFCEVIQTEGWVLDL